MNARKKQGFTIIEAVLIVVVAGIITAVGLTFYQSLTKQQTTATTESQNTEAPADDAPAVESVSDIDAATADLESLDIDDPDDATQLDEQQASF